MDTLSARAVRVEPDRPFASRSPLVVPAGLRRREAGPKISVPCEIDDLSPPKLVGRLWDWLDRFARDTGEACVWMAYRAIARRLKRSEAGVRKALAWLERNGWIARTVGDLDGQERTFTWCLWLVPPGAGRAPLPAPRPADLDRIEFEMPGGRWLRLDDEATRARPGATCARTDATCARPAAHERTHKERVKPEQETVPVPDAREVGPDGGSGSGNGSISDRVGEPAAEAPDEGLVAPVAPLPAPEAQTSDPIPASPTSAEPEASSPPPAPLDPAEAAQLVALVRSSAPVGVRKTAYWALEGSAQLPADLVGLFAPLPAPEAPRPRPRSAPVSQGRPPVAAAPTPAPRAPSTLDRIAALGAPEATAAALAAEAEALGLALAAEWGQPGSLQGFASRFRRAAEAPPERRRAVAQGLAVAYGAACKPSAANPGAVFMARTRA